MIHERLIYYLVLGIGVADPSHIKDPTKQRSSGDEFGAEVLRRMLKPFGWEGIRSRRVTSCGVGWGRSSEVAHLSSLKLLVEYWTQTTKRICADGPLGAAVAPQAQAA